MPPIGGRARPSCGPSSARMRRLGARTSTSSISRGSEGGAAARSCAMHRTINWILMLAMLASIFALYAIKDGTRRLEARVQAQERALERAENDVSVLTAERAHLARPRAIRAISPQARDVAGCQRPISARRPAFLPHPKDPTPAPFARGRGAAVRGEVRHDGSQRSSSGARPAAHSPALARSRAPPTAHAGHDRLRAARLRGHRRPARPAVAEVRTGDDGSRWPSP